MSGKYRSLFELLKFNAHAFAKTFGILDSLDVMIGQFKAPDDPIGLPPV